MKYGYIRVSTKHQNTARQEQALDSLGLDKVFLEKCSGKNFERAEYMALKSILKDGDEVFVKSLDRLGRNKDEMKAELQWFEEHGVVFRITDIPTTMCDFPEGQDWIRDMVNNILIEVLGSIAEQERKTTLERQADGIAAMPVVDGRRVSAKTGRGFGRPKSGIDTAAVAHLKELNRQGEVTVAECCERLGISRGTWYNLVKAS